MNTQPLIFKLNSGIDTYNPPLESDSLKFFTLDNLEPRLGRIIATAGYELYQDISLSGTDAVLGFAYYTLPMFNFTCLYAFSKTSVYFFDFQLEEFDTTPIYGGFASSDEPYTVFQWYDALYVTKLSGPFVKIQHKTATVVSDAIYGKYGIVANSHVMFGNVNDGSTTTATRIRWSDLDAPESFELDPNNSEADFFDLEPTNIQITGMSYQRGSPLVYSESAIWIGTYVGFPGGFTWQPLFTGLGNIFHYAVVRYKEVDYFISNDNIYSLNGFQPTTIGDDIWERFIEDVKVSGNTKVFGYSDSKKDQVFWVYQRKDNTYWSIVYNVKEGKWTERDPQDLTTFFDAPKIALRGFEVIDDVATLIGSDSDLIDDPDAGYPVVIPQLVGAPNATKPVIGTTGGILKLNGDGFNFIAETFDFFFNSIEDTEEINKCSIEFTGSGNPNLQVSICGRKNQDSAVTWSSPVDVENIDGSRSFYFRSSGVGKYIRFKFTWTNTATDYITDLRLISFRKVEDDDSDKR